MILDLAFIMDIKAYLKEKRQLSTRPSKSWCRLRKLSAVVYEAMRYSLFAGGKRVRPILALAAAEALGVKTAELLPCGARLS